MSVIDEVVAWNRGNAARADPDVSPVPGRGVCVVTCMDVRLDPGIAWGLALGDGHILRNAGARVTEDMIRSIAVSQFVHRTHAVALIGHTRCGLEGVDDMRLRGQMHEARGRSVIFDIGGFEDVTETVRDGVLVLRREPHVGGEVRGFVHDIETGLLSEVEV